MHSYIKKVHIYIFFHIYQFMFMCLFVCVPLFYECFTLGLSQFPLSPSTPTAITILSIKNLTTKPSTDNCYTKAYIYTYFYAYVCVGAVTCVLLFHYQYFHSTASILLTSKHCFCNKFLFIYLLIYSYTYIYYVYTYLPHKPNYFPVTSCLFICCFNSKVIDRLSDRRHDNDSGILLTI